MQWWELLGLFACPGFAECCRTAALGRRGRSRGRVPGEQDRMEKQSPGNFCLQLAEILSGAASWLSLLAGPEVLSLVICRGISETWLGGNVSCGVRVCSRA